MIDLNYAEALKKSEHLKALGETTVYLRSDEGFPFRKVTRVESGPSYRLGGPTSCYLIAEVDGLAFRLSVEFEARDANGRGVSMFDRDRLRELFVKLPPVARESLAVMFETECLPSLAARRAELQDALNKQADSEDCVRGLILSARERVPA